MLAHGKVAAHSVAGLRKLAIDSRRKLLGSKGNRNVGIVARILLGGNGFVRGVSFGQVDIVVDVRAKGSGE